MEDRIAKLDVIADAMLGGIELDGFSKRLELQKAIYFVQLAGLDLGFRYSWYHYGPYSRTLTQAAFQYDGNREYYDDIAANVTLTAKGKSKVKKVVALRESSERPDKMPVADWLELLASLHYLKHIAYRRPGLDDLFLENAAEVLERNGKDYFTEQQIERAWQTLSHTGLIDDKYFPSNP